MLTPRKAAYELYYAKKIASWLGEAKTQKIAQSLRGEDGLLHLGSTAISNKIVTQLDT
jgi:hypothetical protein